MDLKLNGKVALVTGASRGIGKAVAATLIQQGCKVMLNSRTEDSLALVCKELGGNASYFSADVTSPDGCVALTQKTTEVFGPIDILICNVGSGTSVPPGQENHSEWQRVFGLNFFSTTNTIEAALPRFNPAGAAILCISSIAGLERLGAPVTYATAKAALNAYVKNSAAHFAQKNIRINAIAPGNILFEGGVWDKKVKQDKAGVEKMLQSEVPQHRFGTPQEIADYCAYLVSPRAAFITGAIQVIDGGQTRS